MVVQMYFFMQISFSFLVLWWQWTFEDLGNLKNNSLSIWINFFNSLVTDWTNLFMYILFSGLTGTIPLLFHQEILLSG